MKYIVDNNDNGKQLLNFLKSKKIPFSMLNKLLRTKKIFINNAVCLENVKIKSKDVIELKTDIEIKKEKPIPSNENIANSFKKLIIFENEHFIAINKPDHIAVQLGSGLNFSIETMMKIYSQYINETTGSNLLLRIVHRLDKDTSGVLLIAKNLDATRIITNGFKNKKIHKIYYAIVSGSPKNNSGTIKNFLAKKKVSNEEIIVVSDQGDYAVTEYSIDTKLSNNNILVKLTPMTGRTHQLRVHMQYIKCPILGDKKYNKGKSNLKHMFLHAFQITLDKSLFGEEICIKAELPKYFLDKINN